MKEKTKYVKIPLAGVIFFSTLLAATSFFSGFIFLKSSNTKDSSSSTAATSKNVFAAEKTSKPSLKFFVMSFCPYGNEIETTLKPIAALLGDKADIQPQYIFEKATDLPAYCKSRAGDPSQCSLYVQNKYFKDETECKKVVNDALSKCLDEKSYIKASNNAYYTSLHGRVEANQDVREICAWNLSDDKTNWWNFVDNVNKNCNSQNADVCWESQAKAAGLDTNKITECFNKDAVTLIEKEIALTDKNQVTGSPTLLINDVKFPPESAYTQDGKGTLTIGKKVIAQDKFRTSETIKEAICASFKKAPKECKTIIAEGSTAQPASGGCGK